MALHDHTPLPRPQCRVHCLPELLWWQWRDGADGVCEGGHVWGRSQTSLWDCQCAHRKGKGTMKNSPKIIFRPLDSLQEKIKKMMKYFLKYDEDFEYGADLPELFLRSVLATDLSSHPQDTIPLSPSFSPKISLILAVTKRSFCNGQLMTVAIFSAIAKLTLPHSMLMFSAWYGWMIMIPHTDSIYA